MIRIMNKTAVLDPVLLRLKAELTALYGPRLKQILLYGSRARGDNREDSDYDVLVVLNPPFDWWEEIKRMAHISSQHTFDTGAVLSLRPVTEEQIHDQSGFMHEVRREGRSI
jgi:predicted nucleotidyltransferase